MSLPIPYIGGPVALGSLYDARTDQFLTGVKLWSQETTSKMTTSQKRTNQSVSIEAESSFSDKASKLDIKAHMKLSFLCGKIEVEGSGKYLNDSKTSINSESLTFSYSILTDLKELHLGPEIEHPKFLDDGSATHVVTGITFGARAFLVFERERKETDSKTEISGSLKGHVAKLKGLFEASGELKVDYEDKDAQESESIKCRYYGDFKLEPPPLTLKEAFTCVRSFTSENANSPIQIYLTPLSQLGGKAQPLIRHISDEQLNEAVDYCQVLNDIISAASARMKLLEDTPWKVQRDVIAEFVKQVQVHKTRFTGQLLQILPSVRETGKCDEIRKLLSDHRDSSPFSSHQLQTWLSNKEREGGILQCCAESLTKAGAQTLTDMGAKDQFGLQAGGKLLIEIRLQKSRYLQELKDFLDSKTVSTESSEESWIASEDLGIFLSLLPQVTAFLSLNPSTAAAFIAVIRSETSSDQKAIEMQIMCLEKHKWIQVQVPLPPTDLKCIGTNENEARFTWTPLQNGPGKYNIQVFKEGQVEMEPLSSKSSTGNEAIILNLHPGTAYEAHVSTVTAFGDSQPSERIKFSTPAPRACSEFVRAEWCYTSPILKHRGEELPGQIFQLKKHLQKPPARCNCSASDCICPISYDVGDSKRCSKSPKFMLIVGETGTGKSTFINGIANAYYKVQYNDSYRFKLIVDPEGQQGSSAAGNQAHSQTSVVAVYTLFPVDNGGADDNCRSAMDCPLTIIDTPGFGDTRGLAEDERIVKRIAKVLGEDGASIPGMTGILHAIGFLVKASQNRLTIPQKYIFDQALSLFGKDVEQIILPVLTFADSSEPQALAALKEDKVLHERYLKFNNGMLYADNSALESLKSNSAQSPKEKKKLEMKLKANILDWDQGELNYLELFEVLEQVKDGVSLEKTRDVLRNRKTLELCMEGLMQNVKQGIAMLTSLQQELDLIDSLDAVIKDADAKKTQKVRVSKVRKRDVTHGGYVTLCMVCSKTCHDDCAFSDDRDKRKCSAMDSNGNCTKCPKNCYWEQHCNRSYYFEDYEAVEIRTVEAIAEKYKVNLKDKDAKKQLIRRLLDDFLKTHSDLSYNLVTIYKCLQELEKLALRQYPLSVVEYVDNLIRVQENEKKRGWENRVKHLEGARKSAQIIAAARDGQDPFGELRENVLARCRATLESELKKKKGLWDRFTGLFDRKSTSM